ncbi:MAG: hypothetical protein U0942_15820 [Parvibaculum sp.]|uniref:hypothetical protein n=1 Tax=Parvibaculum sp. TaxID=2024848 RepID=UPI002AB98AE5|nr:hypothetical protein [Parvibaculum sp.]MDZ4382799.1 hypothetical protein [Parvibaculum sp.]
MTVPSWPLQGRALLRGWQMKPQNNRASFQPETGPPITRRRGTAAGKLWSARYRISEADFATFEAWFAADAKSGTLPFDMPHPRSCVTTRFSFTDDSYAAEEHSPGQIALTVSLFEHP